MAIYRLHLGDAEGEGLPPSRLGNALEVRLAPLIDVEAVDRNTLFFELVDLRLARGHLLVCCSSVPRFSCFVMFRVKLSSAPFYKVKVRLACAVSLILALLLCLRIASSIEPSLSFQSKTSLSVIPLAPEGDKQAYLNP